MASKHHNTNIKPEGKPFRLVKYFAVPSFLVLILISFPFAIFISQRTQDILLERFKDFTYFIGENLNNSFFNYFYVPVAQTYGEIQLSNENQQKLLDNTVRDALYEGTKVVVVKLYSIDQGIVVYSTDPSLIRNKVDSTPGYEKAVKGEQTSEMLPTGKSWALGIEKIGGIKKIKTYIPVTMHLSTTGEEYVIGVFEVILDVTKKYNSIVKVQYYIFGVFLLFMAILFFALLFIVHNAEEIIKKRAAEQKELEAQLHLAERLAALGQMVAGVSHEIKNPLGIIQSTAELLTGMNQTDEKQKRLSLVIKEESVRLNNIVTEFLDFARPYKLNIEECRLDEIIRKNISFLEQELDKKGIKVRDNLEGRDLIIHADPERLYRVFMNLFINSIQAIEGAGGINISVDEERNGYLIKIEDTGTGIDKETMQKIFNPFFTTKEKGSGLGLSIVRNIIEGHEGTISIESDEGASTRVIIYLPKRK